MDHVDCRCDSSTESSIILSYSYHPVRPVAPVAYQVILEPGISQFHEFESPRVDTRYSYKFVETFSCAQIDLRKARERGLATLDEKPTSSGIAEPCAQ